MGNESLSWYVYTESINQGYIQTYNIFEHHSFLKECKQHAKNFCNNREQFETEVKRSLMYYFWSKCEWEIILSDWPPSKNFDDKKIDVYDQVLLNWDKFIDWLWSKIEVLKKVKID